MIRPRLSLALIALVASVALGCAPQYAPPDRVSLKSDVAARKALAMRLDKQGKLIEALNQWKVLQAIDPNDREVAAMLEGTARRAKALAQRHFEKAEGEIAKRRFASARINYIKTLAYDPNHKLAKKRLVDFELVRNRRSRPRLEYNAHQ